ncbi:dihydrodipicolinate synthase family protein [Terrihabitans rhizophilus]|uniref:Dihydrodipicolinate synthase family protein n=1 Tax=Terrihabitans rhizophilus TaxID=3092662 RepID=A0ABU4RMW1_9HYPH|nr:dihydrodipicolinate synthase family protein [Terrihabitans sp. PJ23]MDX6806167.1 dihydrodipicolinate synthase family protein [Terrihabitans sp. PJ23]
MAFSTIVPPLTPFRPDLEVDYAALQKGVDYVVRDCAADVVIAAGVEAQEYQFLTLDQRRELVRQTVAAVGGRTAVAVGISHPSFRIAIEFAQLAEQLGADSVQLLAPQKPTGGAPTTAELVRYFELIGRETSLPIILYLNAGPGADLTIPQTIELAKLDRVHFIKESSRDITRVSRLIHEIDLAGHARYFTTMQVLLTSLQLGGSGITLPPPAARIAREVIRAYEAGDLARAVELQGQFALFPARWMPSGLAAVMKAAANHLGIPAGEPYPPYAPVSGDALESLHRYLDTTALTKEAANA